MSREEELGPPHRGEHEGGALGDHPADHFGHGRLRRRGAQRVGEIAELLEGAQGGRDDPLGRGRLAGLRGFGLLVLLPRPIDRDRFHVEARRDALVGERLAQRLGLLASEGSGAVGVHDHPHPAGAVELAQELRVRREFPRQAREVGGNRVAARAGQEHPDLGRVELAGGRGLGLAVRRRAPRAVESRRDRGHRQHEPARRPPRRRDELIPGRLPAGDGVRALRSGGRSRRLALAPLGKRGRGGRGGVSDDRACGTGLLGDAGRQSGGGDRDRGSRLHLGRQERERLKRRQDRDRKRGNLRRRSRRRAGRRGDAHADRGHSDLGHLSERLLAGGKADGGGEEARDPTVGRSWGLHIPVPAIALRANLRATWALETQDHGHRAHPQQGPSAAGAGDTVPDVNFCN